MQNKDVVERVAVTFRMPRELYEELLGKAREENRSLTGQIVYLLSRAVSQEIVA